MPSASGAITASTLPVWHNSLLPHRQRRFWPSWISQWKHLCSSCPVTPMVSVLILALLPAVCWRNIRIIATSYHWRRLTLMSTLTRPDNTISVSTRPWSSRGLRGTVWCSHKRSSWKRNTLLPVLSWKSPE